eukprot:242765-Amphidinium_carterae.1
MTVQTTPEGVVFEWKLVEVLRAYQLQVVPNLYYYKDGHGFGVATLTDQQKSILFQAASFVSETVEEKTELHPYTAHLWRQHYESLWVHGFQQYAHEVSHWFELCFQYAAAHKPRPKSPQPSYECKFLYEADMVILAQDWHGEAEDFQHLPLVTIKLKDQAMTLFSFITEYLKGRTTLLEVTLSKQLEASKRKQLERLASLSACFGWAFFVMYNGSDRLNFTDDFPQVWVNKQSVESAVQTLQQQKLAYYEHLLWVHGIIVGQSVNHLHMKLFKRNTKLHNVPNLESKESV